VRVIMQCLGALLAAVVLGALLLDEGEVVTLVGHHAGQAYETQLWVVELDGRSYLRARDGEAAWLSRLGSGADVQLRHGHGTSARLEAFRATPSLDSALRQRVDEAMAAKYGLADRLWSTLSGTEASVPVTLVPAPPSSDEGVPAGRELREQPRGAAHARVREGWA
jgi:hypothetical protein